MKTALLIYDNARKNSDLYYATKFLAPDDYVYIEVSGKKIMLMSPLEIDRAKRQAKVDKILSLKDYQDILKKKGEKPLIQNVLKMVLKELKIKTVTVPSDFPFALAKELEKMGFKLQAEPKPFFKNRLIKSSQEIKFIEESQKMTFNAMGMARDVLKASKIKAGKLFYRGLVLTSERLCSMIDIFLLENGFVGSDTIVAGGLHSIDPHDVGSGPLKASETIIIDIFPQSQKTRYFGDATRTFCKGKVPLGVKKLYETVKIAEEIGFNMIYAGINGRKVHETINNFFEKEGYKTEIRKGRNVGFFHSTGHGLGLDCHEEPQRISFYDYKLEEGHVFTVEPGLYYPEIGGVRIEDTVVVRKNDCKVLGKFPKKLEV